MQTLKKNTHWKTASAFIISLFFLACQKELSNQSGTTPDPLPDLTTKVTAQLVSGFVTDENDTPVKSATVQVGGSSTITDKYGYFEVHNALVTEKAAMVSVLKDTYFKATKTFIAATGKSAFFRIKLLPKTNAGNINAAVGGSVSLVNGLKIQLPANAVVNAATNAAYTGMVNIAAQLISAADPGLNSIMPGDLRGLNTNNNLKILTTYGMAAVELTGTGGELLQIASGKKATLSMPIPAALLASAPQSIPLWYFDEVKGLWKEEGSAVKTGGNYVGEVSHFSYWNCDVPSSLVQFNCTLVNQNGQPLQNALVRIENLSSNTAYNWRYGYTDQNGYTGGAVPANSSLRLEVIGYTNCNTPFLTHTFNTTNTNISLGNIIVNTISFTTISGTVTNCANATVTNGFVMFKNGYRYDHIPVVSGAFTYATLLCTSPASFSIIAEDETNAQQSVEQSYAINQGNNAIGNIQACGLGTQQFINFAVNNTNGVFAVPADITEQLSTLNSSVFIKGTRPGNNDYVHFNFTNNSIGANSIQQVNFFNTSYINDSLSVPVPVPVNITEYGAIGQFIAGNFTGTFKGAPPANISYSVTVNFRVRRRL
jgi:hypothetical protein